MISKYKLFNESLMGKLKGKTEEDIRKKLNGLSIIDKMKMIKLHNLGDSYMPTDEEIGTIPTRQLLNVIMNGTIDKKYKLYTESLRDKLKGKSDEEVKKLKSIIGKLAWETINYLNDYGYSADPYNIFTDKIYASFFDNRLKSYIGKRGNYYDRAIKVLRDQIVLDESFTESLKDKLKGKSDGDIIKLLDNLSDSDRIKNY